MKKIWFVIALLLIAAFVGYQYLYQDHRDVAEEAAAYTVTAYDIATEFEGDPDAALKKYLDQTIVIDGQVSEVEEGAVTLNEAVYCKLLSTNNDQLDLMSPVRVKGRCIGYDELLEVIKLDQTTIIQP